MALLTPGLSKADIELSVAHKSFGDDRLKEAIGYGFSVGNRYYLWGSYHKQSIQLVGQSLGGVRIIGGGLGLRVEKGRWAGFGEFGYFDPKFISAPALIRDEAVVTTLNNNHGWRGTRTFEHTVYKLEPGYGGRIGGTYQASKYIHLMFAYRWIKFYESLDACTGSDPDCKFPVTDGIHWQERNTLNFSGPEAGITVRF